jgi:hypothetical protein
MWNDKKLSNHSQISEFDPDTKFCKMMLLNIWLSIATIFLASFIKSAICVSPPILGSGTTLKAASRVLHNVRRSHNEWLTQSASFQYIDGGFLEHSKISLLDYARRKP